MSDQFLAEIRIFGFNFAPTGWAFCNGQILPLSQNTALFALIGTVYGGNGQSNFALPNLQDSVPMMHGQGTGLSQRFLGEVSGTQNVSLLTSEIPVHNHMMNAVDDAGVGDTPVNQVPAQGSFYKNSPATNTLSPMTSQTLTVAGASLPHNNMMPYLSLNFCIALQGIFPPRP